MYFVGIREALLIVALQRLPFQSYPLLCQRGRKRAVKSLILVIKCSGLEVTNITATCNSLARNSPLGPSTKEEMDIQSYRVLGKTGIM